MSKPKPPAADQSRQALIEGSAAPLNEPRGNSPSWTLLKERHGTRLLRLDMISQVIHDSGVVGGPWFIRCDGQQLPCSETAAREVLGLLGLSMEVPK